MCVHLMTKVVWSLVKGEDQQIGVTEIVELKIYRKDDMDVAAGEIYLVLE